MILANNVALWFLALAPVVALAYLVKRKLRERRVASLFLWEETLERTFSTSRNFRIRNVLGLILALAITFALIGALAEPVSKNAERAEALIVALDNSLSMNALEKNGETRLELAKEYVRKVISCKSSETQVLILTTAREPKVVCGFTNDVVVLNDCVDRIVATDFPCEMSRTLETAEFFQSAREGRAKTLVVSDGCFENAEHVVASLVKNGVAFKKIGEPLENVGIVAFKPRRGTDGDSVFETLLEVANFSDVASRVEVELQLDGALLDVVPLQLGPNERVKKFLKTESNLGGELTARLTFEDGTGDALANDDAARENLSSVPPLNVLIYGSSDRFLNAVFASLPNVATREIETIPTTLADDELLTICGDAPKSLPQGKILLVNPTSDVDYFSVGDAASETFADSEVREGTATRFLKFDDVSLQGVRSIDFADGVSPIVWVKTPDAPLIFSLESGDASILALNFSCSEGALPLRAHFPILFANVVGFLRGDGDEYDETSAFSSETVAESNLKSSVISEKSDVYDGEETAPDGEAIWRTLATLALILALLEFYWYCRRKID